VRSIPTACVASEIQQCYAAESSNRVHISTAAGGIPRPPVALEVYYDPQHEYNVARMIEAMKKSLAHFSAAYSPYQFRQLRILEFPDYEWTVCRTRRVSTPTTS
jgi:hypothetical protein